MGKQLVSDLGETENSGEVAESSGKSFWWGPEGKRSDGRQTGGVDVHRALALGVADKLAEVVVMRYQRTQGQCGTCEGRQCEATAQYAERAQPGA